jgi:putative membrane protein
MLLAAPVMAMALHAAAWAQTPPGAAPAAPAASPAARSEAGRDMGRNMGRDVAEDDRRFMEHAARSGLAEVQVGQLARSRAGSAPVREFAQRMVQDHGAANGELASLARQRSVKLPSQPSPTQKRMAGMLAQKSGPAFDRAYMDHMVDSHGDSIATFERAAGTARDPAVRAFAAAKLPTLREHMEMARSVQAALGTAPR